MKTLKLQIPPRTQEFLRFIMTYILLLVLVFLKIVASNSKFCLLHMKYNFSYSPFLYSFLKVKQASFPKSSISMFNNTWVSPLQFCSDGWPFIYCGILSPNLSEIIHLFHHFKKAFKFSYLKFPILA